MIISLTRIGSVRRSLQIAPLGPYFAVWLQRRELSRMPRERLRDMGITPAQAAAEAARPFWDLRETQHR